MLVVELTEQIKFPINPHHLEYDYNMHDMMLYYFTKIKLLPNVVIYVEQIRIGNQPSSFPF